MGVLDHDIVVSGSWLLTFHKSVVPHLTTLWRLPEQGHIMLPRSTSIWMFTTPKY